MRVTEAVWLTGFLALAGCKPAVKTINVEPASSSLESKDATVPLKATVLDADGKPMADARIAWSTSDQRVAVVEGGRVKAVGTGLANITATVEKVSGRAQVRVTIPSKLEVKPPQVELPGVGMRAAVLAQVLDDTGGVVRDVPLAFSSSDEKVLKVEGPQLLSMGPGVAKVSVTGAGLSAEVTVTVKLPEVAKLSLAPAEVKLNAGETAGLVPQPIDGAGQPLLGVPFTFLSSDEAVAMVAQNGMVTAVKKGKAVVKVTGGGKSAEAKVTVAK